MPAPSELLTNLDDYGAWIAAVVAGLGAIGWLTRRVVRTLRAVARRAHELGKKIDALEVLAARELEDEPGSTKEHARQAASLALAVESIEHRVDELERWRVTVDEWRTRLAG